MDFMTHLVLAFQGAGQNEEVLMQEINLHIYEYPGQGVELPEEEWSGFVLSAQGRVATLLRGFEYRGFSFVTYLNRTLKWHLKTYYQETRRGIYDERFLEAEAIAAYKMNQFCAEGCSFAEKILYVTRRDVLSEKREAVLKGRLFYLVLKNILFFREEEYLECADLLGYSLEEALDYRIRLCKLLRERVNRQRELIGRRNHYHYRISYYQRALADHRDREKEEDFRARAEHFRRKKARLNEQIRRVNTLPTNREIARILGVPKGSVDSGLYYLKDYLGYCLQRTKLAGPSEMFYPPEYGNSTGKR